MNYNQVLLYLQELTNKHTEKKQAYDTAAAGLESNMAKLEQVRSVTDGFVPQSIGVTINSTKFFCGWDSTKFYWLLSLGSAINFQMISRFVAVGKRGFAAVHVVVTVGDGLMDWFLKFS